MEMIKAGSITFVHPNIVHIVFAETTNVVKATILGIDHEAREIYLRELVHDGRSDMAGPYEVRGAVSSIIHVPEHIDFPLKV